jgi:exodeoxyribonuclease III
MRLTTWNVNGIRAVLNKGAINWVNMYQPDVLCLQEIKARPEQISGIEGILPGWTHYWNPAVRPGYSGVATFARNAPESIAFGLGEERFDIEGRVIRTQYPSFYLYNIYFPNGQRGQDRVDYKLAFYAHLLKECDDLHRQGKNIIITGDFNTAHREIDLANPKQNIKNSGFLPEERVWIDTYLEHDFMDVYRVLYPDRVQYTWWTYISNARSRNIGWRLDYFLVSKSFASMVKDVIIHDEVTGSDHCPVTLVLDDQPS